MIDFHAHLDLYPDPQALVRRCVEMGVYVLSVTTTPSAYQGTRELALDAPRIRTALGLHPQVVGDRHPEMDLFEKLLPDVRYVGEVGLDGSVELRSTWELQGQVFNRILELCSQSGGRTLSIHSRRAARAVLDSIERNPGAGTPILHWFSGSMKDARRAIALDCWFSVGPAMLQSVKGRALVRLLPRTRILTESDGPFVQIAGRTISPWDVATTYIPLAEIWDTDIADVEHQLKINLRALASISAGRKTQTDRR